MSLLSRLRRLLTPAQEKLVETAADVAVPGSAGLSDIRHVVILMQENRSFDHYFGTMSAEQAVLNAIAGIFDAGIPYPIPKTNSMPAQEPGPPRPPVARG